VCGADGADRVEMPTVSRHLSMLKGARGSGLLSAQGSLCHEFFSLCDRGPAGGRQARHGAASLRGTQGPEARTPLITGSGIRFERFLPWCIVAAVSKLTKVFAMLTLALWGLAAMHCTLEAVPGFDFLKSCCFVDSAPPSPKDCESDGCGAVEDGSYRPEEQTASAPQPLLTLALLSPVIAAPMPELHVQFSLASKTPPELLKIWQFSYRTALPPRAPSIAS